MHLNSRRAFKALLRGDALACTDTCPSDATAAPSRGRAELRKHLSIRQAPGLPDCRTATQLALLGSRRQECPRGEQPDGGED
eukprot:11289734-Alexandrium_andersonii.AAC.1